MTDLSMPPLSLLPVGAADFTWPTPDATCYPGPSAADSAPACKLEGLNGHSIEGLLTVFDPAAGMLQLRMTTPRKPLPLRLDQFRRLRWNEPLKPLLGSTAAELALRPQRVPFTVSFKNAPLWKGYTIGHREEVFGLFLFEPLNEAGAVQRWFVPRAAYDQVEIGIRLGEALVNQLSVTPQQLQDALAEQEQMRTRKLGDMLVVRQIITADELSAAIDQQAKMPMVRIGEALTALGYISGAQLEEALALQRTDRSVPLGELLVKKGLVSRADLQTALARKMGYPLVDVTHFPTETEAVSRLPFTVASRTPALPLMMRAGRMVVALEDPSNRRAIDEIEFAAQCKLLPVLARSGVLATAVLRAYEKIGTATNAKYQDDALTFDYEPGDAGKLLATMEKVDSQDDDRDDDTVEQSDNSLVRLINSMIQEAHSQGVSDIHIECRPGREKVQIRFRKDGMLSPYMELPHTYRSALIARLKIMCDLDISERRKPQDGKINFAKFVQGSKLELRVATIPTHSNLEDAVMRLLASSKPIPIDKLNLSPTNLARLTQAANRPYGMLLCVGPTGSGKTTTLHSVLSLINTPERKIWTAEDPIEITQAGLRQVQVNAKIEWTFARALRSFLRADPDVIMVGEVRDQETAQVAIEASLTGHLVLSTLHTNSAPETVTRLLDMGLDPFNFADALLVVLAQRLVRRLCSQCRVATDATPQEVDELLNDHLHVMAEVPGSPGHDNVLADWRTRFGSQGEDGTTAGSLRRYKCAGCDHCGHTGYRGRAGIHELMMMSRQLRHLIQTNTRADDLQRQALAEGMRTLRQDGIEKVLAGVTSIEEVRANS